MRNIQARNSESGSISPMGVWVLTVFVLVAIPLAAFAFLGFSPQLSFISDDESLASFVRRRAGDEVLDWLVGPFISGVYAGDPEQLSAKSVMPKIVELEKKGSVLTGMKRLKKAEPHDGRSCRERQE